MLVSRKVEEHELVALGGCLLLAKFKAEFLIECGAGLGIGDPNAGVEEFNHAPF